MVLILSNLGLNMSINPFTIGVPVALEHFCVNCTLIGAKGR